MIGRFEIRNFKGIQYLPGLELRPFQVLAGPNASGKSTLLEALDFVRACVEDGPRAAVEARVPGFFDLTFLRRGGEIAFAFTLHLPDELQPEGELRYRFTIALDAHGAVFVKDEWLERMGKRRGFRLLGKTPQGREFYRRENGTHTDQFQFGADKLALAMTFPDLQRYPTGNAVKAFLGQGIHYLQLNTAAMRAPSPASAPPQLARDGANLARAAGSLLRSGQNGNPDPPAEWIRYLRHALGDLETITSGIRESDNAEFLVLKFGDGLNCPTWLLSEGTLRLLALTLPAFLPATPALYLIEEPENGAHPKAIEVIMRALASIPRAQVLAASHSPLVARLAGRDALLCFSRDRNGVRIVSGSQHPDLREWKGTPDFGALVAAKVLDREY